MLFVSSDARPLRGGIARCLDAWLAGLSQLGQPVGILALLASESIALEARLPERQYHEARIGVEPRRMGPADAWAPLCKLRTVLYLLGARLSWHRAIRRSIKEVRPAWLVVGSLDANAAVAYRQARAAGARCAVVAYGSELRAGSPSLAALRSEMMGSADLLIAVSGFTEGLLKGLGFASHRIVVVPPAIAPEVEALASAASRSSGQPRLPEEGPRLITVARLVERKGIQDVLTAVAELRMTFPRILYDIVGEGEFEASLNALTASLGLTDSVRFHGGLADDLTWDLLSRADIFVLTPRESPPGHFEGFGIAYLEAGAFGKPAVATRCGGAPEAVQHGITGLVVEPADPPAIAQAVASLARDGGLRDRLGLAGRSWALQHSPRRSAQILQGFLDLESASGLPSR